MGMRHTAKRMAHQGVCTVDTTKFTQQYYSETISELLCTQWLEINNIVVHIALPEYA